MKANTVISIAKELVYAQDGNKNYILFSEGNELTDFFMLKDCDAAVFEILAANQKMELGELKDSVEENYNLGGISIDQYLPHFVNMLKEKGFIAVN